MLTPRSHAMVTALHEVESRGMILYCLIMDKRNAFDPHVFRQWLEGHKLGWYQEKLNDQVETTGLTQQETPAVRYFFFFHLSELDRVVELDRRLFAALPRHFPFETEASYFEHDMRHELPFAHPTFGVHNLRLFLRNLRPIWKHRYPLQ